MKKLELLGVFFWVQGGLYLAGALLFAAVGVLGGLGIIEPSDTVEERLGGVFGCIVIAVPLLVLGVGHLVGGTALRRRRAWARTVGLVLGVADVLCCCDFPLGTALGIFTLVVLFSDDVMSLFAPA
jgi:hypothetical protein